MSANHQLEQWIRNDLLAMLDRIATDQGEKTRLINRGLELAFAELAGEIGPFPGKEESPALNVEQLAEEMKDALDAILTKHLKH